MPKWEPITWLLYLIVILCMFFALYGVAHAQTYLYCTTNQPPEDVVTAYHTGGIDAANKAVSAAMLNDGCYTTPDRLRLPTIIREPSFRWNNLTIQVCFVGDGEASLWTVVIEDDDST